MNRKRKKHQAPRRKTSTGLQIAVICIVIAMLLIFIKPYIFKPSQGNQTSQGIEFKKEGELSFLKQDNNETIKTIDIEIADNDYDRAQGLMHRYKMSEEQGMLFIMEQEERQSFWMRNTHISLDILYVDASFEIVKIQKYTIPLSDDSVPSIKKAKYVVEVIAGFCDQHHIQEGHKISYTKH